MRQDRKNEAMKKIAGRRSSLPGSKAVPLASKVLKIRKDQNPKPKKGIIKALSRNTTKKVQKSSKLTLEAKPDFEEEIEEVEKSAISKPSKDLEMAQFSIPVVNLLKSPEVVVEEKPKEVPLSPEAIIEKFLTPQEFSPEFSLVFTPQKTYPAEPESLPLIMDSIDRFCRIRSVILSLLKDKPSITSHNIENDLGQADRPLSCSDIEVVLFYSQSEFSVKWLYNKLFYIYDKVELSFNRSSSLLTQSVDKRNQWFKDRLINEYNKFKIESLSPKAISSQQTASTESSENSNASQNNSSRDVMQAIFSIRGKPMIEKVVEKKVPEFKFKKIDLHPKELNDKVILSGLRNAQKSQGSFPNSEKFR